MNKQTLHRSIFYLATSIAVALAVALISTVVSSGRQTIAKADEPTATNSIFLPIVAKDAGPTAYRIGYGATTSPITRYSAIRTLMAGLYTNSVVSSCPTHPN